MKKILFCFFLLFSSIVNAEIVKYSSNGVNYWTVTSCTNLVEGDVFDTNALSSMCPSGKSWDSVGKYGTTTCIANGAYYEAGAGVYNTLVCDGVTSTGYINVTIAVCESPNEINPETGLCEEPPPSVCESAAGETFLVRWKLSIYGSSPPSDYWCGSKGCSSFRTSGAGCAGDECNASFEYTSSECDYDESRDDSFCNDIACETVGTGNGGDTGGDNGGDNGETETPDDSTIGDSNGTVSTPEVDPTAPLDVEEPAPVTPPESGLDVDAIVNMNKDINKALTELNKDVNKSSADIQDQLKLLNASNESIKSQLVQSEQTAINAANRTINLITAQTNTLNNAIQSNTNAIKGVETAVNSLGDDLTAGLTSVNESLDSMGTALDGIETDVAEIGDAIDGLAKVDLRSVRDGTCIYHQDGVPCQGYYEPKYPDGFGGIVDEHFSQLQVELTEIVDGMFGNIDLSNAAAPNFCLNVMQFGTFCYTDYFDLGWVFTFIRACMMFGTVMLARKLVFGG